VAGAVCFFAYACAQGVQEIVLAGAPPETDQAASYAFALSAPDRFRAIFLYICFFGLVISYAAVCTRLRPESWALAGLGFIALFISLELVDRAVEIKLLAHWQGAWIAAVDPATRGAIEARVTLFERVQGAISMPRLVAHALASLAFAIAARGRDRWTRLARLGFALNFVRASIRFLPMQLGVAQLAPLAAATYLPLTLLHALSVGLWLAAPPGRGHAAAAR
jgi:hypothetical protein